MKSLINIYKHKDYKRYLSAVENDLSLHQRGFRSRLSEALDVQNAYVSKVMNQSEFNFTLEQTMKLANFLGLKEDESTYLVWLVEWERAGTKELKEFCAKHIHRAQTEHLDIKNRVGVTKIISQEHLGQYCSHWLYPAAHLLTSFPAYNSLEKMAEVLLVDPKLLREILVFLVECGLVNAKGDAFTVGPNQIHIEKKTPDAAKYHSNLRLKAIDNISDLHSKGLHYSTISSLSQKDYDKLIEELTEVILKYVETVKDSKDETVCCFNLDLFKIVKD